MYTPVRYDMRRRSVGADRHEARKGNERQTGRVAQVVATVAWAPQLTEGARSSRSIDTRRGALGEGGRRGCGEAWLQWQRGGGERALVPTGCTAANGALRRRARTTGYRDRVGWASSYRLHCNGEILYFARLLRRRGVSLVGQQEQCSSCSFMEYLLVAPCMYRDYYQTRP